MRNHSLICVVDTSVIIDLHNGRILEEFFRLPYRFVAPDLVIDDLEKPDSRILLELGLQRGELSGAQILEIIQLRADHRKLSVGDLAALVLTQARKAILLTSDGPLREIAQQKGMLTHGTLWILDEMTRLQIISKQRAAGSLQAMCDSGSRLPPDECAKRFTTWLDT